MNEEKTSPPIATSAIIQQMVENREERRRIKERDSELVAHFRSLEMELLVWNVKSTTKACDGLYVYDTVQRLNDSRFGDGDVKDIRKPSSIDS